MDFVSCPYNAEHKIKGTEMRMHIMVCQDRQMKEVQKQKEPLKKKNWKPLLPAPSNVEVGLKSESFGPHDPERLLQCPYDVNHQIRAFRFPYHLIKCRKNHADIARQLATCPFNARHIVPRAELSHHISSCDDKSCIEQDIVGEKSIYKRDASPCRWKSPPCEEDWERDLQHDNKTFMWGLPSYPVPSTSGSNILMDPKFGLASSMRAPKSMPYMLPWKTQHPI
ncbi:hypothetical protein GDO86_004426 [Hymenochirus boettgeri]|uniref:CHHC U11-48K-type domain-containing protein n=1 Tax=Hymenochirus boettgeri TaxID=247094 RepID=A0A8T2K894_9PIPI|nr:hypothetical protein GDO86_004426 [Hymenochirus boettgeri]